MAEKLPYGTGTIKLTWINPKDNSILESSMHLTIEDALDSLPNNIDKNNFLLFELIETDGVSYKWKLLKYGRYSQYKYGMDFFDNDLLFYGTTGLTLIGIYSVLKFLKVF